MALPITTDHAQLLANLDRANQALMAATDIHDKAAAIQRYFKQQSGSLDAQNHAAILKFRAQRKLGELLDEMPKRDGGQAMKARSHDVTGRNTPTLEDIGIQKMQSSRWQQIAAIPEPAFEAAIAETIEEGGEVCGTVFTRLQQNTKRESHIHAMLYINGKASQIYDVNLDKVRIYVSKWFERTHNEGRHP